MGVLYAVTQEDDEIFVANHKHFVSALESRLGVLKADKILGELYAGIYTLDRPLVFDDTGYYFNASN